MGISFIIQQGNIFDVSEVVSLAERLRVDYLRLGGIVFEGDKKVESIELSDAQHQNMAERLKEIKETATVPIVDSFSTRSCAEFPQYASGDTCYYSYLGCVIGADMRLYPCCIWKYRPRGVVADLNEMSFKEAILGGALDRYYERFDIGKECNRCFLKDKNDFLHELVENPIQDVNFV